MRRPKIGLQFDPAIFDARAMATPEGWDVLDDPRLADLVALDDPRRDPWTLALAHARLRAGAWDVGYLVLGPGGRAVSADRTNRPARALALGHPEGPWPSRRRSKATTRAWNDSPSSSPWPRPDRGRGDRSRWRPEPMPLRRSSNSSTRVMRFNLLRTTSISMVLYLLAHLLGATLVDVQEELVGACRVLARRQPNPSGCGGS